MSILNLLKPAIGIGGGTVILADFARGQEFGGITGLIKGFFETGGKEDYYEGRGTNTGETTRALGEAGNGAATAGYVSLLGRNGKARNLVKKFFDYEKDRTKFRKFFRKAKLAAPIVFGWQVLQGKGEFTNGGDGDPIKDPIDAASNVILGAGIVKNTGGIKGLTNTTKTLFTIGRKLLFKA